MKLIRFGESPTFLMSNHPQVFRLATAVAQLNNQYEDLTVVCDAAIAPVAKAAGIKTIAVHSPGKQNWTGDRKESARVNLMQKVGHVFHLYKGALQGPEVTEKIAEELTAGRSVFMCPSAVSNPNANWRIGVGVVASRFVDSQVKPAFVNIPLSRGVVQVKTFNNFRQLTGDNLPADPHDVSSLLQTKYRQAFLPQPKSTS